MAAAPGRSASASDAATAALEALEGRPLTGFEIAQACRGRVVGDTLFWLYPTLYRLEAQGAVAGRWDEAGTQARRRYSLLGAARSRFRVWRFPSGAEHPPTGGAAGPKAEPRIAHYLERMRRRLVRRPPDMEAILRELTDHVHDAAAARGPGRARGPSPEELFGPPEELATAIGWARAERRAFWKTLIVGVVAAPTLLIVSATVATAAMTLLRALVEVALRLAFAANTSMGTPALSQRQLAFPLAVGTFVVGRLVAGQVFAVGDRRGPLCVAALMAAGVVCLAVPALCVGMDLDAFTVLVLAGIPVALVLGVTAPTRYRRGLLSRRGILAAVALGLVVLALPFDGLVVYSAPDRDLDQEVLQTAVDPVKDFDGIGWSGRVFAQTPSDYTEVCGDAVPISVRGWFVETDTSRQTVSDCRQITSDMYAEWYPITWAILPPVTKGQAWLLRVSIYDRSGKPTVVASSVVVGAYRGSVVGWLTGEPGR